MMPRRPFETSDRRSRVAAFLLGTCILATIAWALPAAIGRLQGELSHAIEARGLEPDGLFYTETEEVAEAFNYLTNSAIGASETAER